MSSTVPPPMAMTRVQPILAASARMASTHHIGGFSGAVFLLIDGVNRKSHLAEVGLVDVFISQNQVTFSRMKFLYKVQTGLKAVKRGAD